jgi:hypothetical protein
MRPLDFDFLKSRYDFELQRREQQTASLGLPVGVLGGLGSVTALMARSFTWTELRTIVFFGPLLVFGVVAFVVCMVYLSRVYHRQTYVFIPKLADLENALQEWRDFYQDVKVPGADEDFFEQEFRKRIIDATDRNTDINDERSALLYWARVWLLTVLWITTLAGIPYVADQVRHLMPRPETTQQQPAPQPATTPQNTRPQPPPFPPNREIREGDIPRRPNILPAR